MTSEPPVGDEIARLMAAPEPPVGSALWFQLEFPNGFEGATKRYTYVVLRADSGWWYRTGSSDRVTWPDLLRSLSERLCTAVVLMSFDRVVYSPNPTAPPVGTHWCQAHNRWEHAGGCVVEVRR